MNQEVAIEPRLLRAKPRTVFVEMTSHCNVRCIYCPVSLPGYHGQDLELDVDELVRVLRRCHPREVQISGHGETTMLDGWAETALRMIDAGLPLALTTNLAKRMSEDEICALSRMATLRVSVDTSDAKLLARLRKGVALEHIEETLSRVQAQCQSDRRPPPYIQISCTLSDVVVPGLPDLVRWCAERGAHALGLVNLVLHDPVPGAIAIRHPAEADPAGTRERIDEALRVAGELGVRMSVIAGLREALEDACR
jgi:MoaA/NifB/PqqE/SkfB family radical SAM enzyme